MPEGDLQLRRRVEILLALRHWYARRSDPHGAWVCCDINVYYKKGDPKTVVSPDVAVAFGVDAAAVENKTTYKVWEAGAAPCFALEIASPNTVLTDLRVKPARYAELGVQEYWRLDPTGGELLNPPLQAEQRRSGRWTPIDVTPDGHGLRGHSEALGLDLCWHPPKLRLWDRTAGAWLLDNDDQITRADTAETRASAAETRADTAETRASAAETRADTAETRASAAETRADTAETRASAAETRASAAEAELAELRARLGPTP